MTSISPKHPVHLEVEEENPHRRHGWRWVLIVLAVLVGALMLVYWMVPMATDSQTETFGGHVDELFVEVTGDVTLVA